MARLTAKAVENVKAKEKRREIPDDGCRGLYLVVQPVTGAKSWCVRFRFRGQPRKHTLLGFPSLAAARREAAHVLHEVEQGRDPREAKRQAQEAAADAARDTLQGVCTEYLKREAKALRTAAERESVLRRLVYPSLGSRPIGEIKRSEIVKLLDRIEDGHGPVAADRCLALVRKIMNWHASRSDEFRTPIVRGMARTKPKERARSRVLSDDELRRLWAAAEASPGPFAKFVQFLLLTGARRSEASAMTWGELSGADWTLPSARNKVKVDLVRPLSSAACNLLASMPRLQGCPYVFSTDGRRPLSGFSKMKRQLDAAAGVSDYRLHDVRRSARSLLSRAGTPSDHAELCLGHVLVGVRGTYDRHEYHNEKSRAYEALATQIERIVDPQPNVVALRGTAP